MGLKRIIVTSLHALLWTSIGLFCLVNTFIYPLRIHQNENFDTESIESKADDPVEYSRFYDLIRTKEGDSKPAYQPGYRYTELMKAKSAMNKSRLTTHEPPVWESLGPANVAGRTRVVLVDKSDPTNNTWYAGTAGGGIWKTTDGGTVWTNKTPEIPNLATTTIVQSQSNPDIFYAGSGEGFAVGGSIKGSGVYKSTDHGESWFLLPSTIDNYMFENVNRLILDPTDENVLLICSNTRLTDPQFFSGILKSVDGGASWNLVYEGSSSVQQLLYHPSDFSIQYGTQFGSTVIKSTDSGDTWEQVGVGLVSSGRIELAIAPDNPNRLFASTEGRIIESNGSELYVSDDGGSTWSMLREVNNGENYNWFGDQGFHNNSVIISPMDIDEVYIGGIDLHRINLEPGESKEEARLLNVFENGTVSFLGWINWGGGYLGGGFDSGIGWFSNSSPGYPKGLVDGDMISVEIRFGPGIKQMAHRFTVDPDAGTFNNGGQGVPPEGHHYQDYVEVPFQVWDIENNIQLMASFRDQERDGMFDLNERDDEDTQLLKVREYLFVHAIPYDANTPDPNVTVDGGYGYKNIYSMWPKLKRGVVWDPDNLPDSKLRTYYDSLNIGYKSTLKLTNANGVLSLGTVHPDHHSLQIIEDDPTNFKILNANDGGVYVSNSSSSPGIGDANWTKASGQLVTGQFYGLDKKPGENIYIGGLQDNGVWVSGPNPSVSSPYNFVIGGDGGEIVWNYRDPSKVIASNQYNRLFYSEDGGLNWEGINGYPDLGAGEAPFITRIGNSKSSPDLIYLVGQSGVSRSADFGKSWNTTSIQNQWMANAITSAFNVKVSEADYNIVWAGGGMSSLLNIHVSTDGGTSFTQVNKYSERTMGSISGMATHPTQPNTAYLLFSLARTPKILRTLDLGETWTDISGFDLNETSNNGFPDVAVYSLYVNPVETNQIWAGTEIGIFESNDDGASWHFLESNLPSASIWQIKAVDNQVIVSTHGRGLWSTQIDGLQWPENIVVGMEDALEMNTSIYPNPASEWVNIKFHNNPGARYVIKLIDLSGKVVKYVTDQASQELSEERILLDDLSNGIYIVNIESGGISESSRIMVIR